jgi:hypothetical protein
VESCHDKEGRLALITTLMLVCGAPTATAQSYGATGPARADTTDPNSCADTCAARGVTSGSQAYARGDYRMSRAAPRRAAAPQPQPFAQPAPQIDQKAMEAQRNTALLLAHAMNPWAATASQPAAGTPARRARR